MVKCPKDSYDCFMLKNDVACCDQTILSNCGKWQLCKNLLIPETDFVIVAYILYAKQSKNFVGIISNIYVMLPKHVNLTYELTQIRINFSAFQFKAKGVFRRIDFDSYLQHQVQIILRKGILHFVKWHHYHWNFNRYEIKY